MRHFHLPLDSTYSSIALILPIRIDNDSGVAHVLEHLLLLGSEKYPFEDLFFTACGNHVVHDMNAATYPDRIILHATAWNENELASIIDMYQSLIKSPLLRQSDFDQEGVRIDTDGIGGVVFNEMLAEAKSPFFSPINHAYQALYQDARAHNANGNPDCLKDLCFDTLINFWHQCCDKDNAIIISAGPIFDDIPQPQYLKELPEKPQLASTKIHGLDTQHFAWSIGDIAHPTSFFDGWMLAHLIKTYAKDAIIDERNADLVLFSTQNRQSLLEDCKKANSNDVQSGYQTFIQPDNRLRPGPLMWLHRMAASYIRYGGVFSLHHWLNIANERHHLWQDDKWRRQRIDTLLKAATSTMTIEPTNLPTASTRKIPKDIALPAFFRKETPKIQNPFALFDDPNIIDYENPPKREVQLAVERTLFENPVLFENLNESSIKAANQAALFIPLAPMTKKKIAAAHILSAYWTLFFLHPEIRRKQGAYGALARYLHNKEGIVIIDYRDPNIAKSLDYIGDVVNNYHEIKHKKQFEMSARLALGRLSPRIESNHYYVNNVVISSLEQWSELSSIWHSINTMNIDDYNEFLPFDGRCPLLFAAVM